MSPAKTPRDPIVELAPVRAPEPQRLDAVRARLDVRVAEHDSISDRGRRSARRPWWMWGGAAASVLAATAIAVPYLSTPAYATWTAQPALLEGASAVDASEGCAREIGATFDDPSGTGPDMPSTPQEVSDIRPVLIEARGQYDVTLMSNEQWLVFCMRDSGENRMVGAIDLGQFTERAGLTLHAYRYDEMGIAPGEEPAVLTFGRVAEGTTGVTVTRDEGADVEASVTDEGFWAAWWPGALDPSAALTPATASGPAATELITTVLEETYRAASAG
jgi:hypothetical protein